jgi:hypothetical protein
LFSPSDLQPIGVLDREGLGVHTLELLAQTIVEPGRKQAISGLG